MKIIVIAAVGRNGALGANGVLPWHCPVDLRHFRALTMGRVCLMGRNTADGLRKPLRDRVNLVMTRNPAGYQRPGFTSVSNMADIQAALDRCGTDELWVCGGAAIYREFLPIADVVHLTQLDIDVPDADTWYPMDLMDRFTGTQTQATTDPLVHFWVFTPHVIPTGRARTGPAIEMALNDPVAMWIPRR